MRGVLVAFLAAIVLACPTLAEAKGIGRRNTLPEIEAAIRKEAPIGRDVGIAKAYLDANHVEHSDVTRERVIYAIIRDIKGGSFLASKAASIRIKYDDQRRVTHVEVFASFTGL
jgi:hypothetical protein